MANTNEQVKAILAQKRRQILDGVLSYTVALAAKLPPDSSRLKARLEEEVIGILRRLQSVDEYGEETFSVWSVLVRIEIEFFPGPGDNHLTPIINGLRAWDELLRIEARGDYRDAFKLSDIASDIIAADGGERCVLFARQNIDEALSHEKHQKWLLMHAELEGQKAAQNRETAKQAEEFFAYLNHEVPQG